MKFAAIIMLASAHQAMAINRMDQETLSALQKYAKEGGQLWENSIMDDEYSEKDI